ncbi:MAG: hypothetical protein ACFB51_17055 [Anaerolineae bacterium]
MSARGRPAGRWWLVLLILPVLAALVAGGMALAGPQTANLTPVPTQAAAVLPSDTPPPPTATLTAAAPPTATPPPPSATLPQVDYSLLEEELAGYARALGIKSGWSWASPSSICARAIRPA